MSVPKYFIRNILSYEHVGLGATYDSSSSTLTITGFETGKMFILNWYMNNTSTSPPSVDTSSGYTVIKSLSAGLNSEGVWSESIIGTTTSTTVTVQFKQSGPQYLFSAYQA